MAKKVWITTAVTGAIHTPSMSPYLPITPQQIIDDAVGAAEAGSAVVHIHARDPKTGAPSGDLDLMGEIVSGIKKRSDVVICITTGAGLGMDLATRLAPIPRFKPELASLNAGSIDFCLAPVAAAVKRAGGPKFDWELPYLEGTWDLVFANSFKALESYNHAMHDAGTRPEFEVYDAGMINNIAFLIDKGIIKTPPYIQFVLGILGGLPATVENLVTLHRQAKDLIGDFHWSVCAAGRFQFPICAAGLAMGGNVRVGLEDNLSLRPGVPAKTSAEQVVQMREVIERLGLDIYTSAEVREIMKLKGSGAVAF
ncbi:MAG: 3-keto-5-aminohexanoate cleavage protein [Rhodospirillaceae bacterium]|nr:3-keto-5-aminohexanoate cleavage protein [Rhodospirillaceae bacterium]MEA4837547.1 3-keto-5-aminohexanoate cleavage protein [Rhodospirillaceae bacterium]